MQVPLKTGMVITNEPGYYKAQEYGIRIENILAVKELSEGSNFLEFECLTLVPYCKQLVEKDLLEKRHLKMIQKYYDKIESQIKP